MKSALIAALVSAIIGSGSAVAATRLINGNLIQNRSIPATKLTRAAIASLRGLRGYTGPQGPQGEQGPAGPQGAPGAAGMNGTTSITLVRGPNVSISPGSYGGSGAQCPNGAHAVSGGFVVSAGVAYVEASGPDSDPTTWDALVLNPSGSGATATFHTWATCAS